jgi:hypothetical protein
VVVVGGGGGGGGGGAFVVVRSTVVVMTTAVELVVVVAVVLLVLDVDEPELGPAEPLELVAVPTCVVVGSWRLGGVDRVTTTTPSSSTGGSASRGASANRPLAKRTAMMTPTIVPIATRLIPSVSVNTWTDYRLSPDRVK